MRSIDLTWAGGEHTFALPIGQMRALQAKCDAGPQWVSNRLASGQWMIDDVVETIRLGLEGGGMDKDDARKLVKVHVESEPLLISVPLAQAILLNALMPEFEEPVGESGAGGET